MASLILVPTPIGNLEDITLRALRILKESDLITAEDTRTSGKLLSHYEISTPLTSLHQHNEHKKIPSLINQMLEQDLQVAMISDAGTPGISDPGFLFVREALAKDIKVETLPGATAFVPALVSSGIPCEKFVFEGFLPVKKGRQTRLQELAEEKRTMIFYESPYRLEKTLKDFSQTFGEERTVSVGRELTKLHEEHARGTCQEVLAHFQGKKVKGEIVIIVAGKGKQKTSAS